MTKLTLKTKEQMHKEEKAAIEATTFEATILQRQQPQESKHALTRAFPPSLVSLAF